MYFVILTLVTVEAQKGWSERSTWEIKENNVSVTAYISCNSTPLDTPSEPLSGRWKKVDFVVLTGCYPPAPPDSPTLAHSLAARGAQPLNITHLQLLDMPSDARLDASYFKGLDSVVDLEVQAAGEDTRNQIDGIFLQMLPQLNWLTLKNEALPPLQKNRISSLDLKNGQSLGTLGECKDLSNLYLREWRLSKDVGQTGGWLTECTGLIYLKAERMELESLRTVLTGIRKLTTLELPRNSLTSSDFHSLMTSTIKHLTELYDVLETKKILDMQNKSRNMMANLKDKMQAVVNAHKIRFSVKNLILDYNPLHNFCDWKNNPWLGYIGRSPPLDLQFLSLVGTNTSRVCFPDWKLSHLNLSTNNIKELQFGQLPLVRNVYSLVVDVRNNPLREVHFNESDYNALKYLRRARSEKVTVHTDTLPLFDCDCKNGWLGRALREDRVVLTAGAQCLGGGELHAVPPDRVECDLESCEPCTCRRQWNSHTVVMHCRALGLHEMPSHPNVGELHLRGNHIDTIRAENLSTTLTLLDVRDNNISRVDKAVAEALFNLLERRVWLSGNPLACDCDNWALLGAMQAHRIQVQDYVNVSCMDGRMLANLRNAQLCIAPTEGLLVWLGVGGGALVGLLAILGALYTRFDRQLKVWLYARGWCLSCVREEELDADREYDAFVSFAHGDFEFVNVHLLPGLEDGPHGYKVSVHYRDWVPGEMIPKQITRSVASSRRTVIVLSANFVQSMWGMLEFRAAHVSALAEGRVRVLVVALEDTPPVEELPEELRLYLRSTTYLRWNDRWFWKKLRYAMPHRARPDKMIVPLERKVNPWTCDFKMVQNN